MDTRIKSVKLGITIIALLLTARLFYWQVLSADRLSALAQTQRTSTHLVPAERGSIYSSDGFALVSNQPSFLLYAYKPQLDQPLDTISGQLAPLLVETDNLDATEAAKPLSLRQSEKQTEIFSKLSDSDRTWIPLARHLDNPIKEAVESLHIEGLGFDNNKIRYYPEASTSAHLLGFVGRDQAGEPLGYFGLEGYYDLELRGKSGLIRQEKDATGQPIIIGDFSVTAHRKGRDLKLYLNRALQYQVEKHLRSGIEKYGAKSGEVVIMDPYTGGILAMAALPGYDPADFIDYDTTLYKNPVVASSYEPGSTFKVLIMAAALEENAITPDTTCDQTCDGPVKIDKYSIKTWNDQYHPGETMTEVLERSDNTGMIFVARQLGQDKFVSYLKKFGFGKLTGIDLQEETAPLLRSNWGDVDLATASFGQGLATTAIQMTRAVAVLANGGKLMEPHVVASVIGDRTINIKPKVVEQVISPQTAKTITQMMVNAVENGDAGWKRPHGYKIAGKTGTAQIPVSGHYDQDKTIASFVGFAPADHPKFVMLVKLTEPTTSPWGSETAAPLWFNIASDALTLLNVPLQK